LNTLLVCSKSTRDFLPGIKRVRIISSAPTKDILNEVGTEEDVIAIGGGAVIDTAKILSKTPIRCYPTTAAGSSSTSWSVYWDGTTKCSLKRILPKDTILNGIFVKDLPDEVVMSTTCDVVSHCLDSMSSKKATDESIGYCKEALDIIRNKKDNFDLINAGNIAGKAIEITGTNLLHSLSYPLTGYYGISHGTALGYFLPKLSKFMGHDVDDIIGKYKIQLDFDLDFVIKEALKYEKIYEFNAHIDTNTLKEILK
jgi:alcohol dehydrogenase class IV